MIVYRAINGEREIIKMDRETFNKELENFKNILNSLGEYIEVLVEKENEIEFYDDDEDTTYTLCEVTDENREYIEEMMREYYEYLERVKEVRRKFQKTA